MASPAARSQYFGPAAGARSAQRGFDRVLLHAADRRQLDVAAASGGSSPRCSEEGAPRMRRSGLVPLRVVACLAVALFAALAWWTWAATRSGGGDGRTPIVFWGSSGLGEDVW